MANYRKGISFSQSSPPRILLVDDNEIDRKVALGYLEAFRCKIDLAVNGQEAVEMVAKMEYDLIFMDVQMPGMDGLTATEKIRENETEHRAPIVAITAHAMKEDRERCIEAGMDRHLTKPLRFRTLRAILDSHLGPKKN